jgi:hypothetical protein
MDNVIVEISMGERSRMRNESHRSEAIRLYELLTRDDRAYLA